MFFIIVIVVFSLMYGYIGWRMIIPAAFSLPVSAILWGVLALSLILLFLPVVLRFNGISAGWIDIVAWAGYLSFGFLTLLFAVLVARDIGVLVVTGIQKAAHLVGGTGQAPSEAVDPVRRMMIMNSLNVGVLGVTGAMFGYGMYQALRRPDIVEIDVPIASLPEAFNGFRIVQITDIHVSHTIKRPFVQSVVDSVNSLRPDLIALTGDLVDGSVDQLRADVAPLAQLKAPDGMYFITGNHEYYSGVERWLKHTAELGFDVLMNEHRIIERGEDRLLLAGVTDYSGGSFSQEHRSDPHQALAGGEGIPAKVLLAHQPKSIFEAAKAGYDYVICGHTHGGQYFPYHFLAALSQPYVSGLHRHDKTRIYVSRGTGYWGPQLRIGARSEITVHRLVPA
jgi:predicted MPP superfamily phosphohydrolase